MMIMEENADEELLRGIAEQANIPPEQARAHFRENQDRFCEFWGDEYRAHQYAGLWIGASPDGSMIALYLKKPDGSEFRVTFPIEHTQGFQASLHTAFWAAMVRTREQAVAATKN